MYDYINVCSNNGYVKVTMAVMAKGTQCLLPHQGKIHVSCYTSTTGVPVVALVVLLMVAFCSVMAAR